MQCSETGRSWQETTMIRFRARSRPGAGSPPPRRPGETGEAGAGSGATVRVGSSRRQIIVDSCHERGASRRCGGQRAPLTHLCARRAHTARPGWRSESARVAVVPRIRGIAEAKRTCGTRASGIARRRGTTAGRSVELFRRLASRRNRLRHQLRDGVRVGNRVLDGQAFH